MNIRAPTPKLALNAILATCCPVEGMGSRNIEISTHTDAITDVESIIHLAAVFRWRFCVSGSG
ncbi:hypothetical protein GCM10011585_12640 [Edaphobacter dinghuensis]|uniref:Uncharacterized protein n=1 Tax=Edaphobacter dinghuensis TaxID=1560005 RepID=A0A917HA12_9BACT|nr:hypothetical protein GCM10011585_12640 [Edaphobacter dinghuensis]